MRYFCRVAYDGTPFGGWQRQPDVLTIQQVLEEKARTILRTDVEFTGAGRTDAGVHARAQGAHFDCADEVDVRRFTASMNALLPDEVAISDVQLVPDSFHARFSARMRRYRYFICAEKSPLLLRRAWKVGYEIDWGMVTVQLPALLGCHDFTAFCARGSNNATSICTIKKVAIVREGECMVFSIEADRFVYKMVRSLVGTMVDIGRGRQPQTLAGVLQGGVRIHAGTTAPAHGLVLDYVEYAEVG
jgi:tRNA pseudouridine38-40 synthase